MSAPASTDRQVSGVTLAYALFGGILAWLAHLIGIAWMTGRACATGQGWPAHLITAATLAVTLHVLWVSWGITRPDAGPDHGSGRNFSSGVGASRTLGWLAVVLNVFNVVLIIAEWTPVLVLDPCAVG